jgi:hypothetical protein
MGKRINKRTLLLVIFISVFYMNSYKCDNDVADKVQNGLLSRTCQYVLRYLIDFKLFGGLHIIESIFKDLLSKNFGTTYNFSIIANL